MFHKTASVDTTRSSRHYSTLSTTIALGMMPNRNRRPNNLPLEEKQQNVTDDPSDSPTKKRISCLITTTPLSPTLETPNMGRYSVPDLYKEFARLVTDGSDIPSILEAAETLSKATSVSTFYTDRIKAFLSTLSSHCSSREQVTKEIVQKLAKKYFPNHLSAGRCKCALVYSTRIGVFQTVGDFCDEIEESMMTFGRCEKSNEIVAMRYELLDKLNQTRSTFDQWNEKTFALWKRICDLDTIKDFTSKSKSALELFTHIPSCPGQEFWNGENEMTPSFPWDTTFTECDDHQWSTPSPLTCPDPDRINTDLSQFGSQIWEKAQLPFTVADDFNIYGNRAPPEHHIIAQRVENYRTKEREDRHETDFTSIIGWAILLAETSFCEAKYREFARSFVYRLVLLKKFPDRKTMQDLYKEHAEILTSHWKRLGTHPTSNGAPSMARRTRCKPQVGDRVVQASTDHVESWQFVMKDQRRRSSAYAEFKPTSN